jgi:tetratricopeptide (TPR) repeat protein
MRTNKEKDSLFYEFEKGLAQAILQSNPDDINALEILGNALTRLEEHDKALQIDKKITALKPYDPIAIYNLACSYSNLGNKQAALDALEKAIELGYDDFSYMLKDPDLENVRKHPRFKAILESLRKKRMSDA